MTDDMTIQQIKNVTDGVLDLLKLKIGSAMTQAFVVVECPERGQIIISSTMTRSETCKSLLGCAHLHKQDGHGPDDAANDGRADE